MALAGGAAGLLTACGFTPVYGPGGVAQGLTGQIAIDPPPGGHAAEFDRWGWKTFDALLDEIVPFKRGVYEQVVAAFRHLGR